MKDVKELKDRYVAELNEIVGNMKAIGEEIARLDSLGVDLTAKANVLAGKIEALEEVEKLGDSKEGDEVCESSNENP